jgi:hypothetical protein
MTLLLLVLLWQTPVDDGSLVVRGDTAIIAHETFHLASTRGGATGPGWTLATSVRYQYPSLVLAPIVDVTADTMPSNLEFDVADPRDPQRIRGMLSHGRFTVRFLGRQSEKAREFPGTGRIAVLDDSVFALYVLVAGRAGPEPVELTAIVPRASRRETVTIRDLGISTTLVNGVTMRLRHVTVSGGVNQLVDVWLDDDAHLQKVEIPSRHVRAERLPPA